MTAGHKKLTCPKAEHVVRSVDGGEAHCIRDTGLATLLITGVEKSQIASGRRSVGISQ
jgi:hypothetical protein